MPGSDFLPETPRSSGSSSSGKSTSGKGPRKPKVIGGYEILSPLGKGGMAEVYLARQIDLGRTVALKLMNMNANEVLAKRFERETRIHLTLSHPSLVRVYDAGTLDGRPFMALEFIEGIDLQKYFDKKGAPRLERSLPWMKSLSNALAFLHGGGIIHRDIKPANILLSRDGVVKLADFGLARHDDVTQMTRADQVIGTLSHLPPEVFDGILATESADIYALGLVFYRMITGRLPYRGESREAWIEAILNVVPESPRHPTESPPGGLDELILDMLQKKPDSRPSAREVEDRFLAILEGKSRPGLTVQTGRKVITQAESGDLHHSGTSVPDPNGGLPGGRSGFGNSSVPGIPGTSWIATTFTTVFEHGPAALNRDQKRLILVSLCCGLLGVSGVAVLYHARITDPGKTVTRAESAVDQGGVEALASVGENPTPESVRAASLEEFRSLVAQSIERVLEFRARADEKMRKGEAGNGGLASELDGVIGSRKRVLGNPAPLMTAISRLMEASDLGRKSGLAGPEWLDYDQAARGMVEEVYAAGAIQPEGALGLVLERFHEKMKEDSAGDFESAMRKLTVGRISMYRQKPLPFEDRLALLHLDILDGLSTARPEWIQSPTGLDARLRYALDAWQLWRVFAERGGTGSGEEARSRDRIEKTLLDCAESVLTRDDRQEGTQVDAELRRAVTWIAERSENGKRAAKIMQLLARNSAAVTPRY